MIDSSPSPDELSRLLRQHQQEQEDWQRKQLMSRIGFFGTICLGLFVFTVGRWHAALKSIYCTQSVVTCWEINHPNDNWYWMSWFAAIILTLSVTGLVAVIVMTVVWFTRFSRRLYVRGPMVDIECRKAYFMWFGLALGSTIAFGVISYFLASIGR
jgi:hypothetical protein